MNTSRARSHPFAALVPLVAGLAVSACDPGPAPIHLATAHQMGPVAYRDPAGGISPDGRKPVNSQLTVAYGLSGLFGRIPAD